MENIILIVDDSPAMIQVTARMISAIGQLRFATGGEAALQQMRNSAPDLVLLDAEMPGMSGYEVCAAMRSDPALSQIPVIFVTSHSDPEFELKALEVGAVDFIAKPVSAPILFARVQTQLRIKALTDELRKIAAIDPLTETLNRRSFDEALTREWRRGLRGGQAISLLMIDVDHFKRYNDRYGHPAGDACLRAVAQALAGVTRRPGDRVARWGGEEFAVLLPETPRCGAEHLAHQAIAAIERLAIPHEASPTAAVVSVSIGISSLDEHSACWARALSDQTAAAKPGLGSADLLRHADKALYMAKAAGRARACFVDIQDGATAERPGNAAPTTRTAPACAAV